MSSVVAAFVVVFVSVDFVVFGLVSIVASSVFVPVVVLHSPLGPLLLLGFLHWVVVTEMGRAHRSATSYLLYLYLKGIRKW